MAPGRADKRVLPHCAARTATSRREDRHFRMPEQQPREVRMQKSNVTRPSGSAARRGLQIALAALSLAAALTTTPVRAEYPAKIIKIVVPFSSGGGTDIIARTLAQEISSDLGRPVIIENKPGA